MLQRKTPLFTARSLATLSLAAACVFNVPGTLLAQATPDAPSPLESLRGRPDELAPAEGLSGRFESKTTGLAFNPPAGMEKRRVKSANIDRLALYVDPTRNWQLIATQGSLSESLPLSSADLGNEKPGGILPTGLLEVATEELKTTHPAADILRQQVVRPGKNATPIGVLIARTSDLKPALIQQAILKAGERIYFTISLTSPVEASDDAATTQPVSANERAAIESFNAMLETIELMDLRDIKKDQNERLFRTRAFLVNLTPTKLTDAVVPEQWLRIIQNGKDIGYSYVIEEKDIGDTRTKPKDGVRIGVRTRLFVPRPEAQAGEAIAAPDTLSFPGLAAAAAVRVDPRAANNARDKEAADKQDAPLVQVDAETWMWVSLDRREEEWSNVALVDVGGKERDGYSEVGQSERNVTRYLDDRLERGSTVDENQPPVNQADVYTLEVRTVEKRQAPVPVKRPLAPWYIPQAVDHLLPRLLPAQDPKTYLFATYVGGDRREVMNRYVDVLPARMMELGGNKVSAIGVSERTGLEGASTTHWLDATTKKYLGSTCRELDLVVLPTDAADLEQRWKGKVDLTRPAQPATDAKP